MEFIAERDCLDSYVLVCVLCIFFCFTSADRLTVLGEPTLPVYNTTTSIVPPPAPASPTPPTQIQAPPPQNAFFGVSVIARLPKPSLNTAPTNLVASSSTSSFRQPPPHPKSSVSTTESFTNLSLAATATATPGTSLYGSPTGSCFPSDIHGPGELQSIQNSIARRMIGSQNGVPSRSRRRHIYDRQVEFHHLPGLRSLMMASSA